MRTEVGRDDIGVLGLGLVVVCGGAWDDVGTAEVAGVKDVR